MNAVEFLKEQRKNKINNPNNNIMDKIKNIMSDDPINNIMNHQSDMDNLKNITLDDVIFGHFDTKKKKNKGEILHKVDPIDGTQSKKRKVNKNNSKILRLYLKQQAEIINDQD